MRKQSKGQGVVEIIILFAIVLAILGLGLMSAGSRVNTVMSKAASGLGP